MLAVCRLIGSSSYCGTLVGCPFQAPGSVPSSDFLSPSSIQTSRFQIQFNSIHQRSTFAFPQNKPPLPRQIFFHDFLPLNLRIFSHPLLSAWLTSALSVWKTWAFFLTISKVIFEKWRLRSPSSRQTIPEKPTTNKRSLLLNPVAMFCTMSV